MSPVDRPDARARRRATRTATTRRALRRVHATWRDQGPRALAAQLLRTASERLAPPTDDLGIAPADVLRPHPAPAPHVLRRPDRPTAPVDPPGRPPRSLSVGWVVGPPSAGSGGHTTLFRLMRGLEARGHTNVVGISDRHCPGDVATSRHIIETHFPPMTARLVDAAALATTPVDVLLATSWPTAYVVRNLPTDVPRAYVVQDYEPWFSPPGSAATLAEATYRFGFHGICAGRWLPGELESRFQMSCDHFDFGVDTGVYTNHDRPDRRAVAFYARPCTPRRGFGLGLLALGLLADRRPDIEVHLFGEDLHGRRLPFACTDHGAITPAGIDELLNRCAAGLVLSFTNLSLLPFEMLATGCVPVVNDAPHNRALLEDPFVRYVEPTPEALADALEAAVDAPTGRAEAHAASKRVATMHWDTAAAQLETTLRNLTDRRIHTGTPPRRAALRAVGAGS